jgi:hypothetical protein
MVSDEGYVFDILPKLNKRGYLKFWEAHFEFGFPLRYRKGKDLEWALRYLTWIEHPKTGEIIFLKKKD